MPVTVKIRSGWDEQTRDPVRIARTCEDAGARALTLHARTRTQMYSGEADWSEIAAVVRALSIPVIGNGDIRSGADAAHMRAETGCAGIMIARGSHGRPWIFEQARAALEGRPVPADPGPAERFAVVREHARNAIAYEADETRAMLEFRKHLGWYTKGLPDGRRLRQELFGVETLADAEALLAGYLADATRCVAPLEDGVPAPGDASSRYAA